jgi:hypothetical protein
VGGCENVAGEPEQKERPADPYENVQNRCLIEEDARFANPREHIACYDKDGKIRRLKQKGTKRWAKWDVMDDEKKGEDENDLVNLSVSKRDAVRPTKRVRVGACQPPEGGEARYTGLSDVPANAVHNENNDLWDENSYYAVDSIVDERKNDQGKVEYRVRWRGYGADADQWRTEDQIAAGATSLIRNWRDRNKRVKERERLKSSQRKSEENDKKKKEVVPINRTNLHVGDVVAVLVSNKKKKTPAFYLAKVLAVQQQEKKLKIQWYTDQGADGKRALEWRKPTRSLPGTVASSSKQPRAKPHVAIIWQHTVIDSVPSMKNKTRGKLSREDDARLQTLAAEAAAVTHRT